MVLQTAGLCLLLLLAVAVRMVGSDEILSGGEAHLVDPDSHLHAWRMERALERFPALPPFTEDRIAHPDGVVMGWPPGLDYLGGALAWLAGLRTGTEQVARLGTLLCVLIGALCVVLAARLTWRYVRLRWAIVGGTILALAPFHIEYSRVGRVDHHALEPLIALLAILSYFRATEPGRRSWVRWSVACGVALGGAVWLWPTALLEVGLLGLGMVWHGLRERTPPAAPLALAVGLSLAAPLCLAAPYRQSFVLHAPSPVHLTVLGVLLLASLWGWLGVRRLRQPWPTIGAAATLALAVPALVDPLTQAAAFAGRSGWAMILEQRSLFELSPRAGLLLLGGIAGALPLLVWLALAAPLAAPHRREVRYLALWSGAVLLLGTVQVRFMHVALALSAPLVALGLSEASRRLSAALRGRARPRLLRATGPALALGTLTLQWPTVDYLVDARSRNLRPPGGQPMEDAARRITTLPRPRAVLAPISVGNMVVYLGRAPVVGTALIDPWTERANRDTIRAWTTLDLTAGEALVHTRRVSHVLVGPLPTPRYAAYLRYLGRPADRATLYRSHRRILAVRLFHDLGSGAPLDGDFLPAVSWLQHAWESTPRLDEEPAHLFRVVPGARLEGRAAPWSMVELRLPLVTSRGRPFEYQDRRRADSGGRFRFRLPYWSARTVPGEVSRYLARLEELRRRLARGLRIAHPLRPLARPSFTPLGPLELRAGDRSATVDVPRRAVLEGQTVRIEL